MSWYDYRPGVPTPNNVTHLRIGFLEYQRLMEGEATETTTIEVPCNAFGDRRNLQQVQIYLPTVSKIGYFAFSECLQLEHVKFLMKPENDEDDAPPSKFVSIREKSFSACHNLQSVTGLENAAESLQAIGKGTFGDCSSLASVDFLQSLTRVQFLGCGAFIKSKTFTHVDLSRAVLLTEFQGHVFYGCTELISVHLPPNLLNLPSQTFERCTALENIILPSKLESIGFWSFRNCSKLKSIVLPSSLQRIGPRCFTDCDKLSHVVFPSSWVSFLKTYPFNGSCKSLSSLELPNPVPRHQWPLILEQFCKEDGIASTRGGIHDPKNRNTIVWNFLRRNMAQLFIEDNAAMSRRRPVPAPAS